MISSKSFVFFVDINNCSVTVNIFLDCFTLLSWVLAHLIISWILEISELFNPCKSNEFLLNHLYACLKFSIQLFLARKSNCWSWIDF